MNEIGISEEESNTGTIITSILLPQKSRQSTLTSLYYYNLEHITVAVLFFVTSLERRTWSKLRPFNAIKLNGDLK